MSLSNLSVLSPYVVQFVCFILPTVLLFQLACTHQHSYHTPKKAIKLLQKFWLYCNSSNSERPGWLNKNKLWWHS